MANEQESYIIDFSHTPLPHSKHEDVQMDGLMEQNPDRAARVQQWATKTGYAPEVIGKDLERFEKLQSLPERAEMDDLQQNAPSTYKLITTSYDAPIVADQYREMGAFEKSFKQALNSFNVERLNAKKAEVLLKQRDADEKGAAYGTEFADELQLLERQISAIPQPQEGSAWNNWAWHTSQFGTQMLLAQPDALIGAAGGAAVGAGVGAGVGALGLGAGAVPGAATGALWGARGGYVAGLAKYSYDIESAFAYEGLRNLRDKNGNPIPVEAAIKASRTVGYINAALETAGDLVFAGGVLKPVGKLGGKVAGKTVSKVLGGRIAKLPGMSALAKIIEQNPSKFEKLTLRQALIKAAQVQLVEAGTETSTEYAQNVVQLTAEEQAKAASKQPFERRTLGQIAEESAEGMGGVFVGSMVLGGVGAASHLANSISEMRQAEQTAKLFKDLHDKGVKDLKLTERAPEKAIQFLGAQTNGTAVENVYVPIKAIDRVAQENQVDPHEFLQAIAPDAAAQYDEAKKTNGSIEFNTAEFGVKAQLLSKQTGKSIFDALVNDMKADPNARTVNEVAEEQQLQQAELEKTANQAEEMIKKGTAKQAELDAAKQDWLNHLAANVDYENVDPKKAEQLIEANAQLMARMDVVEAHKRGMDYFEFRGQQPRPGVQMQLSPRRQQAYDQARKMYDKIKDALARNEETRAQQENGGLTPIIDYLIKRGGVMTQDTDWAGETENWRRKESNVLGLVNNRNGLEMRRAADIIQAYLQDNGWGSLIDLSDPGATTADVPDLIEAVNRELSNYVPMYKRDTYSKRLNEILNVSTGQFKTLYEKEFGEKLPDRGTRALKNLHYFLLREAVKDGMKPSESVLAEHNINAEALTAGSFDFAQENANADLFQEINALNQFDPSAPDNAFVKSKWGGVAHGVISPEIAQTANIQPGEIRVYNSLLKHLSVVKKGETMSRLEQIGKLGYDNPIEFIDGVMERLALIQRGNDGSLLLTGKVGLNHTVAIKLEPGNGFYKVTTLMPRRKIDNKKTVWEAALPLRENSRTTGEIGSAKEPIGPNGTISIANKNPKIKAQNAKTDPNSAAFKKWFKNSKVVDENGQPLVVYHGTKQGDFSSFDKSKIGAQTDYGYRGKGFYFTPQQELAAMYSRDWQKFKQVPNENGRVMPVYLSVQNPYIIKSKDAHNMLSKFESESFTRKLQEQGYDGVFVEMDDLVKSYDGELQEIIVFEPTQIKSVYNRGTFDENNANVYFQAVYHGSPHVFDKFALSAIGTGEGAHAHGWGLYFAGNKETAERYREKLSRGIPRPYDVLIYDGKEYLPGDKSIMREALDYVNDRGSKDKAARVLAKLKDDSEFYAKFWKDNEKYAAENKKSAEHYAELLRIVEGLDPKKFTFKKGKLYEVEIPENDVLLNEDKTFSEQPEKVKNAVLALAEDNEILPELTTQEGRDNMTGRGIYESIARHFAYLGTDQGGTAPIEILNRTEYAKAASLELNKHGIKGISYDGHLDGECFVIFDDKAVDILNLYYQEAAGRMRGKFNELTNTITLTPDANASTLTHELAHYWLNERWQFVNSGLASEEYKKDFAPLAKYLDIKEGQEKLTREQHEKFATSFEAYLREGQAPTLELGRLFGRFRRWLIGVYRDIKKELGVELTDDIRRVFDRMLATEDEILAAERERAYEPFTNVPGMSAEDVKRLEKMREDAHNKAVMQIMQRELEELQFENQMKRIYAEEKETEAAEKELAQQPEYQLTNIVDSHFATSNYAKEHGKQTETLEDGTTKEFTRLPGSKEIAHAFHNNQLNETDRALFSVIAENNGMTAPELAERLVSTKDFNQALAEEVDRRMEKYKLKKDMASLRRAIAEAVSNDEGLAVLALERDLFINNAKAASVQRSLESKAMAKKAAHDWLHSKPAQKAAIYSPYFTAQKRAAVKTATALKNQDYEAAAQHKEEELFNAAAAQESIKISRQLHRILEYFKYMQRKKMDLLKQQEHFVQVASILQRLGFGRADYDSSNKVETLKEWSERMKKRGLETVDIPDWLFDENAVLDWRRLNIDQLQDVMSALRNIHHTANFEHRLFTMHRRVNIEELAIQLSQHLAKNVPAKEREKNADNIEAEENKLKNFVEGWLNSQVKFDTLLHKADGYHDFGLMHEVFLRPVKEAADRESVHLRRLTEAFQKLWHDHYSQAEIKQIFDEKKYYPELGNEATKQRLLAIALNMGNDFNKQRLFDNGIVGYKYVPNAFGKGQDNTWNEQMAQQLLRNNLTAKDWDFVQGVWDLINEPWGAISEMHKRLTGFTPGKVEAVPFAIATADGKMAQLRGGYYPIKYDWRTDKRAEKEKLEEDALYAGSPATFATTKQGHTKRRVSKYSGQVSLELSLIDRHIAEVLHDLYFRPVVIDMRRLLGNPILEDALKRNLGRGGYRSFKAQLDNIADGGPYQGGVKPINDAVEFLRRNTTISVLAAKTSIVIENLANPWLFANAIEGFTGKDAVAAAGFALTKYGPQSIARTESALALQQFVFSKSPMMKDKSENYDVTMRQLRQTTFFGQDSKMLKTANALVVATDDFFAIPMWWTCYKKFNDQFIREGKKADVADKLAIERADMLINRVLGSGRRYDAAEYTRSRHALVRALNMFSSFMNNEFNRWCREMGHMAKEHDYERFVYFVANRMMWVTCSMLLAGKWPDDLTPKELLKWWFGGAIDNIGGMFFILRDFTPVVTSKITGSYNFGYRPSPLIGAIEDMIIKPADTMLGFAGGKKKGQDVLESGAKAASYAVPYPQQLNTWFFNAADYVFNGSTPRPRDLYRRRPKKERGN
nr:MAG TPA: crystallin beta/gamma motif-containing protein [Caudoviricetes sp.]